MPAREHDHLVTGETAAGWRTTWERSLRLPGTSIVAKLHSLRATRGAALYGAFGRDLVVVKAGIVEAELARLGLHLRARTRSGSRRVLQDVYEQEHEPGLGFEHLPDFGYKR